MNYDERSQQEFQNIRLRSFFKSIYARIKRGDDCLPSLHEVVDITKAKNERYIGLYEILVENIIGSEGRYEDFNKNFLPKNDALQSRWSAIHSIAEQNKELPPISVFKIDDYYFVRDGNHRVSVAKSRGQVYIDAEVTEYYIDVPITKELTVRDRFKIQEHVNFLEATGLNKLGKGFDIKLTRPRSYRLLLNIIEHFRGPLEERLGRTLTLKEISKEWYYGIFLPFAEGAYLDDLLSKFPNRTTGDLYVWLQLNWKDVKDSLGKRMNILAKPIEDGEIESKGGDTLGDIPGMTRGLNSIYLRSNIGLVITCTLLNISTKGKVSVAIVKRKYHPYEDYWSLPIAMMGENETRNDSANRCARHSIGIKERIDFVQYKTFDNVDRTPYGRMIAFGMIGVHYGDNIHLSAGGVASEIKLIGLKEKIPLVYDHNHILEEAFNYIYQIRNNFSFIKEMLPDEIPLKYIRTLLREAMAIKHERKRKRK
jgi:ADP-ribose pyrophosphatase YjhB (NUDIX family)